MFEESDVISTYSREQAFEDGTLVDVSQSDEAKEAGFRFPVALTRNAWDTCVDVPKGLEGLQDVKGRLWDVLYMLKVAIRADRVQDVDFVKFSVMVQNDKKGPKRQDLWAWCGPGDKAEPVITVMFPEDY